MHLYELRPKKHEKCNKNILFIINFWPKNVKIKIQHKFESSMNVFYLFIYFNSRKMNTHINNIYTYRTKTMI